MSFLLDTNVISEWVKPEPNPNVTRWLDEVDEDLAFLSVASLAEIRRGVELMAPGKRRDHLALWLAGDLPRDSKVASSTSIALSPRPGGPSWRGDRKPA